MLADEPEKVNNDVTFSCLDTGMRSDQSIGREANFRCGFVSELTAICAIAGVVDSVAKFLAVIEERAEARQKERFKESRLIQRTAKKRLKRREWRLRFTESECERTRFCRGRHHAANTAEVDIRNLVRIRKIENVETLRNVLAAWERCTWYWALGVGQDSLEEITCPSTIVEALEEQGGAV